MGRVESYHDEKWEFIITKAPTKRCYYYISNYGRVKSVHKIKKTEKIRKATLTAGKFPTLGLKLQGDINQGISLRRLVAQYFLNDGKEVELHVVHKDGDRLNNHVDNLVLLDTEAYNKWHSDRGSWTKNHELRQRSYKMNEAKVKLLLRRLKEGKTKKKILAKQFNITPMQLNRIERKENWGHVTIDDEEE